MLEIFKKLFNVVSLEEYNEEKERCKEWMDAYARKMQEEPEKVKYWKDKHDIQIQAHQDTILRKDKEYKGLQAQFDHVVEENKKLNEIIKEKENVNQTCS